MGEVRAGVYSLSELGQMYGVWGLHRRLPGQVFYDVRRQELASSVGLLHRLRHLLRGLSHRRNSNQHRLGRLSKWVKEQYQEIISKRNGISFFPMGTKKHLGLELIEIHLYLLPRRML